MSRLTRVFLVAAVFFAASSDAAAQNPPVRNPPVRTGRGGAQPPGRATQAPEPPPVPATHNAKWVGCYDLSVADRTGALRAYGTFDLDAAAAARGIAGHRLATVIGGTRLMRAGWQDGPSDSLRLTAAYTDAGFIVVMGAAGADSMSGYLRGFGAAAIDSARTPVVAHRRPSCAQHVPIEAIHVATATLETDYATVVTHPPLVEPKWLFADSMLAKGPKGKKYVRNALLLRFSGGTETQRHAIVQSLGGIVVGSMLPPREQRDHMLDFVLIVYVEDGAKYDDLMRVASRITWSPIVKQVGLYYRDK